MTLAAKGLTLLLPALVVAILAACTGPASPPTTTATGIPTATPESGPGYRVGERAPDFSFTTTDGQTVTLTSLLEEGRPVVLFFYETWCPTCRAELRSLKDIYPQYRDRVAFYALGISPFENEEELDAFNRSQGFPWPTAAASAEMVNDFHIAIRSTKVAIDRNGVIVFREGYGIVSDQTWHRVFQELSD